MIKIGYGMPLWGGCSGLLLKALQTLQSRAAKIVAGLDKRIQTANFIEDGSVLPVISIPHYITCAKYSESKVSTFPVQNV